MIPWAAMRALRCWLVVAVCLVGCGRINYDPLDDAGDDDLDGGDDDGTDGPDGGPCPVGYTPLDGSCYRVVATLRDWLAAETDCEADGAGSHLATIVDVDEHFDLHDLATAQSGGVEVWIGYTDRIGEGTFRWVSPGGLDPSGDSCFFGAGGPVNSPSENCVAQRSATNCGDWFVRDCALPRPYICEHDGRDAEPSAF